MTSFLLLDFERDSDELSGLGRAISILHLWQPNSSHSFAASSTSRLISAVFLSDPDTLSNSQEISLVIDATVELNASLEPLSAACKRVGALVYRHFSESAVGFGQVRKSIDVGSLRF